MSGTTPDDQRYEVPPPPAPPVGSAPGPVHPGSAQGYAPPTAPAYQPPAYGAPTYQPPAYGAPAYGAPAHPYGSQPYPATARTNVLSIIAFIAGLAGFTILPVLGSIAAVIMGHISLGQLKSSGEQGRGLALTGVILGWIGVGLLVLGIVFILVVFSIAAAASTSYYSA